MQKGDNVLITYKCAGNKKLVAAFLEEDKELYLFVNINSKFAVTKKKVKNGEITIEVIED